MFLGVVDRLIRDRVARRPEVDRKAVDLTRLDRRRRHILIAIAGPEDALLDQEAISVGEDIDEGRREIGVRCGRAEGAP